MLFRFSLYGFLKNQQYYESFLILAFIQKGMSYTQIGYLISFREICIYLFEVPSGAVADVWGRRRSMILSFFAYIVSFVAFGLGREYWQFFPAMFLFAVGEAFRTGTHKAMIFDWLAQQGRADEKTKVYGFTRAWSQIGSAVSVVIAAALVFISQNYVYIFYFSIIPYVLGVINFLGYPKSLDGATDRRISLREMVRILFGSIKQVIRKPALRGLVVETMCSEGAFKALKDYLQPILKQTALALPMLLALPNEKRTAVLVGIVFFVLHILSGAASRYSHVVVDKARGEDRAARWIWLASIVAYAVLIPVFWGNFMVVAMGVYIVLYMLQNFWRPAQISRFNIHAEAEATATVLSIDSQSQTVATMITAPIVGKAVDWCALYWPDGVAKFIPVGIIGLLATLLGFLANRRCFVRTHEHQSTEERKEE
ncbi:MAG: MFS transporter [Planctomycetota bacterium]